MCFFNRPQPQYMYYTPQQYAPQMPIAKPQTTTQAQQPDKSSKPNKSSKQVQQQRKRTRKRISTLQGDKSTLKTSPRGLLMPERTGKTLLGG